MSIVYALQTKVNDKAYNLGYEVGYFIGSNQILILVILGLFFAALTFLLIRFIKKRKMRSI
ncbi:hypothetical protein LZ575_14050 [Antarcticibacterium sp. 1MA-6-2]|uniref:hypothetical protein n=1 Tax=Antarcticibacterium sp. 1MA-6-2 TaxID=2908210 RepID=UPI001F48CC75|nr:hypothetical protein [Antarcticibacterium sp. 1MA-6-2]UJH90045.1 hypothetical protein LZ575_14050 [Antarcticibacterium sp. 1MA-6-2]